MGRLEEEGSPKEVVMCDGSSRGEGFRCAISTDPRSAEELRGSTGGRAGELSRKDDDRYKMVVDGSVGSIAGGGM